MSSTPTEKPAPVNEGAAYVIDGGTITALAGGPLSLAELGPRTTRRASHLEFNEGLGEWEVLDPTSRRVLYRDSDYDVALRWETSHFNRLLKSAV